MRAFILTLFAFASLSLSAQESITRGQDTIAYTSPQGKFYNISIYNDLTAEELHYITSEYHNNNFSFRDNEDLRLTMSRYMEDGKVTANWELTQNEQRLLNKYNVLAIKGWNQSNKSSSPTSKNNVTAGEHLQRAGRYKNASIAILIGSTATATALISADPSNSSTATIIGAVGALASLGLNIAGNMELIAAGKAIDNKP